MSEEVTEAVAREMFVAGWPHPKERETYEAKNGIEGYRSLARAAIDELRRLNLLSDGERVGERKDILVDVLAHLVAAVSLIERGGKKAAPSDKMYRQMLKDYHASIERGRQHLRRERPADDPVE